MQFCSHSNATPLTKLLQKDTSFQWDALQEKTFQDLRYALTNEPVLAFPQYTDPFSLYTDASTLKLGAVRMQCGEGGENHVIAYVSRLLNSTEVNNPP